MTKKRQRKIYKTQAENWMQVCHLAIKLWPEKFLKGQHPSESPDTVDRLLVELHAHDAQLADLDHQTVVGKECLKALKAYSEEWEAPQYQVMDSRQQFTIRYL